MATTSPPPRNDRTLRLRAIAHELRNSFPDEEELTRPGIEPPPRQTMTSAPENVPAVAKGVGYVLGFLPMWARIIALLAFFALVGHLLTHGVKAPW